MKKKAKPSLYGLSRQGLASSVCVMEWRGGKGEILRWSVGSRQRVLTHADISVVYLQQRPLS